jgi:hypothetical protein
MECAISKTAKYITNKYDYGVTTCTKDFMGLDTELDLLPLFTQSIQGTCSTPASTDPGPTSVTCSSSITVVTDSCSATITPL